MTLFEMRRLAIASAVLGCWVAGPAFAQATTPAAAPAAMAPAAASAPMAKPAAGKMAKPAAGKMDKAAVSKECSKEADAKSLHGKERKAFRSKCKMNGGNMG
jgi:hypothetical protein